MHSRSSISQPAYVFRLIAFGKNSYRPTGNRSKKQKHCQRKSLQNKRQKKKQQKNQPESSLPSQNLGDPINIINLPTCIRFSSNRVWGKLITTNWEPVQKTETLSEKILAEQKTEKAKKNQPESSLPSQNLRDLIKNTSPSYPNVTEATRNDFSMLAASLISQPASVFRAIAFGENS
ncbi:hypothetical protein CDAR_206281 [Caerostris darwini]|uniref:Uncharacterized protein n=1 Tax=Caerostris darwini TaxID=1538125 RepID=A0AAV4RJD3_9ARAC|nr:hypothetical protein CDAR_206281 [Caerostris darwini]